MVFLIDETLAALLTDMMLPIGFLDTNLHMPVKILHASRLELAVGALQLAVSLHVRDKAMPPTRSVIAFRAPIRLVLLVDL